MSKRRHPRSETRLRPSNTNCRPLTTSLSLLSWTSQPVWKQFLAFLWCRNRCHEPGTSVQQGRQSISISINCIYCCQPTTDSVLFFALFGEFLSNEVHSLVPVSRLTVAKPSRQELTLVSHKKAFSPEKRRCNGRQPCCCGTGSCSWRRNGSRLLVPKINWRKSRIRFTAVANRIELCITCTTFMNQELGKSSYWPPSAHLSVWTFLFSFQQAGEQSGDTWRRPVPPQIRKASVASWPVARWENKSIQIILKTAKNFHRYSTNERYHKFLPSFPSSTIHS